MKPGPLANILKFTVLGLSVALVLCGVTLILGGGFSIQGLVLRIYLFFFAIKIFFCEIGANFMLSLFPYMRTFFGKGFFLIFVGVLMIGFDGILTLSGIVGLVMLACGVSFILLKLGGMEKDREPAQGSKKKDSLANKAARAAGKRELRRRTGN